MQVREVYFDDTLLCGSTESLRHHIPRSAKRKVRGAHGRGLQRLDEEQSAVRRVAAGAAAGDLLHVEVGEEQVEPVSSRARSDAEQGGHHYRKKGMHVFRC